ncbi:unnamed protein product, partial [Rotaria sp. Silwood1]
LIKQQSQLCPIATISFDQINSCLKEYVHSERKYLTMRNKQQLIKFKDQIHENVLFKIIPLSTMNTNQIKIETYFK